MSSDEKPSKKCRADELLHDRGFTESRTKAQALIMADQVKMRTLLKTDPEKGPVFSEWTLVKKAGQAVDAAKTEFLVTDSSAQDVGRGAVKLRQALTAWPQIVVKDAWALDVGASTGGFTQVLLEKGARKVLALDVGTNQLHERLRNDERVISLEKQHVLRMTPEVWSRLGVSPPFDLIVTDVSFISLTKIIPTVAEWLRPGGSWVMLVKPQFEVGPKKAPGGIVRNEAFHKEALDGVRSSIESVPGLVWKDVQPSPILGGDGNKEFLAWVSK